MSRNRRASARRSAEAGLSVLMMTDRKGEHMDRLTKRSERTGSAVPGEQLGDICLRVSGCEKFDFCEECPIGLILTKLCEYEDTGLTPAQIKGYCPTGMKKKEIQDYEMAVLTQCGIHLDNSITASLLGQGRFSKTKKLQRHWQSITKVLMRVIGKNV